MSAKILKAAIPVLPVAEIMAATSFYRTRLGFTVEHADEGYAVLRRSDVEIHFWRAGDNSWKDRDGAPVISGAESFLAGTASCRLLVTEIETLYNEMSENGIVHPNGPLCDKPYGLREFAVLDCDGNLITFFAPALTPRQA